VVGFPLRAGDGTLLISGQNSCGAPPPPKPPIFAYPDMKLAADMHVVLKLSMHGAVPPHLCVHCLLRDVLFRRVVDTVVLAWCLLCTAAAVRTTSGR
jgi:hypothetical protein